MRADPPRNNAVTRLSCPPHLLPSPANITCTPSSRSRAIACLAYSPCLVRPSHRAASPRRSCGCAEWNRVEWSHEFGRGLTWGGQMDTEGWRQASEAGSGRRGGQGRGRGSGQEGSGEGNGQGDGKGGGERNGKGGGEVRRGAGRCGVRLGPGGDGRRGGRQLR